MYASYETNKNAQLFKMVLVWTKIALQEQEENAESMNGPSA